MGGESLGVGWRTFVDFFLCLQFLRFLDGGITHKKSQNQGKHHSKPRKSRPQRDEIVHLYRKKNKQLSEKDV